QQTSITCADPDVSGKKCGREAFPALQFGVKSELPKGRYIVAVRAPKGITGTWSLFYNHVPAQCVDNAELNPVTAFTTFPVDGFATTCQQGDNDHPVCAPLAGDGLDSTFLIMNCPNRTLGLKSCSARVDL